MKENEKSPEAVPTSEAPEQVTGAQQATDEDLDEMTGGLNLVNKASCSTSGAGSMNTVVSIGTV